MRNPAIRFALGLVALAGLAPLCGAPAFAQTKVWVSHLGTDGQPCTTSLPCATFQHAHDVVAAGGDIGMLDPGDYGAVNISKPVSITNDGVGEAYIFSTSAGGAVTISAGLGSVVSLRGLVIDGQGIGGTGIVFLSGSALHVQNCVVRNFERTDALGIFFGPTSTTSQLFVSDTLVYNNGSRANSGGIVIEPSNAFGVTAVLDRVHLENNVIGLTVDGRNSSVGVRVVIRDSVVSGNAGDGILAVTSPGRAAAFLVVERTTSVNNAGTGIEANGPHATILLKENTVIQNAVGIAAVNSGQLISYGNNSVNNNVGPDGTPTGSYSPI